MFEEAVIACRRVFRVPRTQQQIPHFPLIFGAYDVPPSYLTAMQRFGQTPLLHQAESLFHKLLCRLIKNDRSNDDCLGLELRLSCDESEKLMMNRKVKVEERDCSRATKVWLLAKRAYEAPFIPVKMLNPNESSLMSTPFLKDLSKLSNLYGFLENKYGPEIETEIDYLMQGLNQEALIKKMRAGKILSQFEFEQLCVLFLHCKKVGMLYEEALVAVKLRKRIVVLSEKGEEVDGETEPNVHILLLRKTSLLNQSRWLRKNFALDRIVLADVDFLLDSSNLSNES